MIFANKHNWKQAQERIENEELKHFSFLFENYENLRIFLRVLQEPIFLYL